MIGSYIGILILSSVSLFSSEPSSTSQSYTEGIIYTALGAVGVAVIFVATNKMKAVHYTVITFYLCSTTASVSLVMMMLKYKVDGRLPFEGISNMAWLMMLGASIVNYFAVNLMTKAN